MDVLLKKYFWVVNLVVVAICGTFTGRAVSHILQGAYLAGEDPRPPRHNSVAPVARVHNKDIEDIVKRNVFCSGCVPEIPKGASGPVGDGSPQKSALQLELVSTMVCPTDDNWSMAVVKELSTKEKDAAMVSRGSPLFATNATVIKVVSKRMYLKNGGNIEYLEMEGAAAPPKPAEVAAAPAEGGEFGDIDKGVRCTGNNCTVDKALVEKMLSNTAMLATAARFVPSIKDGKANGFKLYAIRPNSIFGKIGLQNGDTIKAINNMEMSSPDKALEVYTKLRNASHLTVGVERRGETITLDYSIR